MYKIIHRFVNYAFKVRARSKKVYVSGPMTGYPNHNFPAFHKAAKRLRKAGYEVISPAELDENGVALDWANCLIRDLIFMFTCRYIATLPGWTKSNGAGLETFNGRKLKFSIHSVDYFLKNKKEYL